MCDTAQKKYTSNSVFKTSVQSSRTSPSHVVCPVHLLKRGVWTVWGLSHSQGESVIKRLSVKCRTVCSLLATWCVLHMNNSRLLCRKCGFDIKIISASTPCPSFIMGLTAAKLPSSQCFSSFHSAAWFVMTGELGKGGSLNLGSCASICS